jgi:AcrR family transcriptional regulator
MPNLLPHRRPNIAMGRPFTASDEEVLQAAAKVLLRRGPDGFSIAEVASEVGIGRTAIILRFKSTHALKMMLMTQFVEQFAASIAALPKLSGGDGLLQLAAFIGAKVHSRESGAKFFAGFSANLDDPDLLRLEKKRGDMLCKAISAAMPKVAIGHDSAVNAFLAHLTGSIIAWLSTDDDDPRRYLVIRTKEWLDLAAISFDKKFAEQLTKSSEPAQAATRSTHRTRRSTR